MGGPCRFGVCTPHEVHPAAEEDFVDFGVTSETGAANWLWCWGRFAELAGEKAGAVYVLKHESGRFEGSQQDGELRKARSIDGLRIYQITYNDYGDEVGKRTVLK